MKKAANISVVLGLLIVVFNLPFKGELKIENAIGLCLGAILSVIGLFVRSRCKDGVGILTVTDKEKNELKKLRNEFAPRKLLGQLLAKFAGLFILVGIASPLYAHSLKKTEWGFVVAMILFGLFLGFCAALLVNPPHSQNRPPFWLPAVSGLVCSSFVVVMAGYLCFVWLAPKADFPGWARDVLAFSAIGSVLAALVCLVTGISAILKSRRLAHGPSNQSIPPP